MEIIESDRRKIRKRRPMLTKKYGDGFKFWYRSSSSEAIVVYTKKSKWWKKGKHIITINLDQIELHHDDFLDIAKEMSEYLGIEKIVLTDTSNMPY